MNSHPLGRGLNSTKFFWTGIVSGFAALACLLFGATAQAGPALTVDDAIALSKATGRPIFAVAGTET